MKILLFMIVSAWAAVFMIGCNQKSQNKLHFSKECIKLNDQGVAYMIKAPLNDKTIDTAIQFLHQAILCDSSYLIGYTNLANAYQYKGDYKTSIKVYNKLLAMTKNDPAIMVDKGIVFKKLNMQDSAQFLFSTAWALYNKRLNRNANDINTVRAIINLKAEASGKDSAIVELDRQIKDHPKLATQLEIERNVYKF